MNDSLAVLSQVLTGKKIVESKLLNILGVQVFRAVAAHAFQDLHEMRGASAVSHELDELRREGLIKLRDFLQPDHFAELRREWFTLAESTKKLVIERHGPNSLAKIRIRHSDTTELPGIRRFLDDPRLRQILAAIQRRHPDDVDTNAWWECLTQGQGGVGDPQTFLHSDTFFHTYKAWFYLDDVDLEHGPLAYVPHSHHLSCARLFYMYRESCTREAKDGYERVSGEYQERLGLRETVITCPRNTLVVADTCGYHRRLPGEPGWSRRALYLDLRPDPFQMLWAKLARRRRLHAILRYAKRAAIKVGS
jgi:hypothetical protein